MRRLRPRTLVPLILLVGLAAAGIFAATVSGVHAEQKWAGQWHFTHADSPTPGLQGGFALQHREDAEGAELLEAVGGIACPEPTDYFVGAYTVPDSEDLPPNTGFDDTGKFRGCTVGDRLHLRGRYESNSNPDAVRGDFELTLVETNLEWWNGTFTIDGDPATYTWSGFFQTHFDDGAEHPSDPPYEEPPVTEPPPTEPPPGNGPVASETCLLMQATITPNPDAPSGLAISGTDRDDVIVGTDGPDRILGLGGNDTICGFGGDDEIIGGDGDDYVEGGLGSDTLDGEAGADVLAGDYPDRNLLAPTGGDDRISGGSGADSIEGGAGNDIVSGGPDDDTLNGNIVSKPLGSHPESEIVGPDDDRLLGDAGHDTIRGGRGSDTLDGGEGDDTLEAAGGADILLGGLGADILDGGPGNDRIDGGKGGEHKRSGFFGDVAWYFQIEARVNVNLSTHRVTGGQGRDSIRDVEGVIGSLKDDVIRGSGGADQLSGGVSGNDDIYGLGGPDTLLGGGGDDLLLGGPGRDTAHGGADFDACGAERRSGCERLIVGAGR